MVIRPMQVEDTELFFSMMCSLDDETPFMMYEPNEREKTTDATEVAYIVVGIRCSRGQKNEIHENRGCVCG